MLQQHRLTTLALLLALVVMVLPRPDPEARFNRPQRRPHGYLAPPTPSPILVPVEQRLLTSDIVTRGTARYGLPQSISLVPSTAKGATAIITTLPARGVRLVEGDLLLTASERPVFVLQGATPVYRDLAIGATGADVWQLELALARLGFDGGAVDGHFDEQTAAAVTAWYMAADWRPASPSSERLAEIEQMRLALAVAQNDLAAAKDAAAVAPLQVDVVQANAARANKAAAALVAAKNMERETLTAREKVGASAVAAANAAAEVAQAAATATELEGTVAMQTALNAQQRADRLVVAAKATVDRLTMALTTAEQTINGYVPADELVFVPTLPIRIADLHAAVGDPAQGVVLLATNNQLAVDSQLPLAEAALVQPGMVVMIDEPDLGINATGTVAHVADSPGTNGVDGYHVYFETTVDETPTAMDGFSLRLTIPVQSTDGAVNRCSN
ncbi:MAG: peptidoglycan-binding domain-containing protein [Caldilineaceae bacterium]